MSYLNPTAPAGPRSTVAGPEPYRIRLQKLFEIYTDLIDFGTEQGYSQSVLRNALEDLSRTFATEFFTYILMGSRDAATAIGADATLAWLDLDAGGITIRQRLINRLS